jgi:hypothetical protein
MGDYQARWVNVKDVPYRIRELMAHLYLTYYEGTNRVMFHNDLDQKTEVLLLYAAEELVGFTTLQVYDYVWQGQTILVVYSGDTIVEPEHWGQHALAYAWITRMGELQRVYPERLIYWFLIVKGHRTYRHMPVFGKSFYPHWSEDREDLRPLADALAQTKFGSDYNAKSGVIESPTSKGFLRPDLALPTDEQMSKDAVKYFVARNPGYLKGHELVCLCEITEKNMKPLTRRMFARGRA